MSGFEWKNLGTKSKYINLLTKGEKTMNRISLLLSIFCLTLVARSVQAQNPPPAKEPMELQHSQTTVTTETTTTTTPSEDHKGVDGFFNIREANPDVKCGQWQFETQMSWTTFYTPTHYSRNNRPNSLSRDDDISISPSILYGVTDDVYVKLQVLPLNMGDGSHTPNPTFSNYGDAGHDGIGELNFEAFWRFLKEQDWVPAMALFSDIRIPTGVGSEKMDAKFTLAMTKSINDCFRVHMNGFLETANGSRGDWNRDDYPDRRNFQWGVGPGIDYQINPCNLLVFNYLNQSNDWYGYKNNNILELGWVYDINPCSKIKAAVDADCHPDAGPGHWTGKVQYEISW